MTLSIDLQILRPLKFLGQTIPSTLLRHRCTISHNLWTGSSETARSAERQSALYNTKVHGSSNTEGQVVFPHNPSTPQGFSPKSSSSWRCPYQLEEIVGRLTLRNCEIDTNKALITQYDPIKPGFLSPVSFVPSTQTPPTQLKPADKILFSRRRAKCHFCSFETHLSCTSTVGPGSVSGSVVTLQRSQHTTFTLPPLASGSARNSPNPTVSL